MSASVQTWWTSLFVWMAVAPCMGIETRDLGHDPAAVRLLRDVCDAYRTLPAYSDHGKMVGTFVRGEMTRKTEVLCEFALVKPDKFRVKYRYGAGREMVFFRKGTDLLSIDGNARTFMRYQPEAVSRSVISEMPGWSVIAKAASGETVIPLSNILYDIILAEDGADAILSRSEVVSLEADREANGRPVRCLTFGPRQGRGTRLLIDAGTKLLLSVEATGIEPSSDRWEPGPVSLEPLPDGTFDPSPPADFAEMKRHKGELYDLTRIREGMAKDARYREDLVGKSAPEFTLTVLDRAGGTRRVTRADLAGKVVLLDLWATWCGPCLVELPHLQALADEYSKRADFLIVAVSQDEEPAAPATLRGLIRETLESLKLDILDRDNVLIALDPGKTIGEQFGSYGLPTVLVLDREGIVRDVQVGSYPLETREALGLKVDPRESLEHELRSLLGIVPR